MIVINPFLKKLKKFKKILIMEEWKKGYIKTFKGEFGFILTSDGKNEIFFINRPWRKNKTLELVILLSIY